jgi:hypothetical protein
MQLSMAKRPNLVELAEDFSLPSGDLGPVEAFAFARFALICASVAMAVDVLSFCVWVVRPERRPGAKGGREGRRFGFGSGRGIVPLP